MAYIKAKQNGNWITQYTPDDFPVDFPIVIESVAANIQPKSVTMTSASTTVTKSGDIDGFNPITISISYVEESNSAGGTTVKIACSGD